MADELPDHGDQGTPAPLGAPGASAGMWYAWWRGDPLPTLAPPPALGVRRLPDAAHVAAFTRWSRQRAEAYVRSGNALYVAYLDSMPVAYGSVAATEVAIGELDLTRPLPPGNRYLWGFVTEAPVRGQGIYPRLLRAIFAAEAPDAERFWIGHETVNHASARGILKAGFTLVGELFFLPDGRLGLVAHTPGERAEAGAAILGARVLEEHSRW